MTKDISELFRGCIGAPAWNVKRGVGTFITLEFGAPRIRRSDPNSRRTFRQMLLHGEWHLWIYDCHWSILSNSVSVATDQSGDDEINKWIEFLNGQILQSVNIDGMETIFKFDLGGSIVTYPADIEDGIDQWILYHENDSFISLTSSGNLI